MLKEWTVEASPSSIKGFRFPLLINSPSVIKAEEEQEE